MSMDVFLPHNAKIINPFHTNVIFHKITYNKVRIVHCIYLGVTGHNLKKIFSLFL